MRPFSLTNFWQNSSAKLGNVPLIDKVLSGVAALLAIALVMWVSQQFIDVTTAPLLVAPMGATAALLFAVPQGSLSQPWAVIGGHVISAFIGVTCANVIPDLLVAAAVSVGLAIAVMYMLECLHPPGGASALIAVIGGEQIQQLGYTFILTPILLNVLVMLAWALLINNVLPRRHYPNFLHRSEAKKNTCQQKEAPNIRNRLRAALSEVDTYIDTSEDDLARVFNLMLTGERRDRMGDVTCQEIMSTKFLTADYDSDLESVWLNMVDGHARTVTVVDSKQRVLGAITIGDFFRQIASGEGSVIERVKAFVKKTDGLTSDKVEYAGHLMTKNIATVQVDQHLVDLFPLFDLHGVVHIPVVDPRGKMVGLVTIKKLLAALHSDLMQIHPAT